MQSISCYPVTGMIPTRKPGYSLSGLRAHGALYTLEREVVQSVVRRHRIAGAGESGRKAVSAGGHRSKLELMGTWTWLHLYLRHQELRRLRQRPHSNGLHLTLGALGA